MKSINQERGVLEEQQKRTVGSRAWHLERGGQKYFVVNTHSCQISFQLMFELFGSP